MRRVAGKIQLSMHGLLCVLCALLGSAPVSASEIKPIVFPSAATGVPCGDLSLSFDDYHERMVSREIEEFFVHRFIETVEGYKVLQMIHRQGREDSPYFMGEALLDIDDCEVETHLPMQEQVFGRGKSEVIFYGKFSDGFWIGTVEGLNHVTGRTHTREKQYGRSPLFEKMFPRITSYSNLSIDESGKQLIGIEINSLGGQAVIQIVDGLLKGVYLGNPREQTRWRDVTSDRLSLEFEKNDQQYLFEGKFEGNQLKGKFVDHNGVAVGPDYTLKKGPSFWETHDWEDFAPKEQKKDVSEGGTVPPKEPAPQSPKP